MPAESTTTTVTLKKKNMIHETIRELKKVV